MHQLKTAVTAGLFLLSLAPAASAIQAVDVYGDINWNAQKQTTDPDGSAEAKKATSDFRQSKIGFKIKFSDLVSAGIILENKSDDPADSRDSSKTKTELEDLFNDEVDSLYVQFDLRGHDKILNVATAGVMNIDPVKLSKVPVGEDHLIYKSTRKEEVVGASFILNGEQMGKLIDSLELSVYGAEKDKELLSVHDNTAVMLRLKKQFTDSLGTYLSYEDAEKTLGTDKESNTKSAALGVEYTKESWNAFAQYVHADSEKLVNAAAEDTTTKSLHVGGEYAIPLSRMSLVVGADWAGIAHDKKDGDDEEQQSSVYAKARIGKNLIISPYFTKCEDCRNAAGANVDSETVGINFRVRFNNRIAGELDGQ